ncbi:Flap endonuclease GEN-like 2 [Apostasia shenzhenica]|uniref:Single-strand DNA endonuclease 1 n=1 Tax=Apostasia shenzhenica TaxID=1088818 RepID=A0A2I0ATE8_9ASPA|nr:Flap endonuclease GEN-like 2 [Apostasia shenzhenica]
MGVKNLWDILESCKKTLPLQHLQNKRLCVDLSCWLIQFQQACRSPVRLKEKLYLKSLFHRLRALIALNCDLIFVADGAIPSIKLSTYRRRLGSSLEVTREDTNMQNMTSLRRNMGSEFSCMIKEAKVLGLALGIPCLDGVEEAEAQCAALNLESLCDGCFTSDSDIFLFGARTVYRDIYLGEGGYVICYDMADIEGRLGFGRHSLIALSLLLGSDYSRGVNGFGPETACQLVKSIGEDNILQNVKSEGSAFAKKLTNASKRTVRAICIADKENIMSYKQHMATNGKKLGTKDDFLQVVDAYLKPKCHLPDSKAVQSVTTPHPFLRARLQEICAKSFGWSPVKTDEYILPKIAERDLRRFASLRNVLSECGENISLNTLPVPCPVSAIVKLRKVRGRECFEVSWHAMDGLQSSVVSADLVKCACPEKLSEFMERKIIGNKRNKRALRPKRDTRKADLTELYTQLQDLLLDKEPESHILPFTSQVLPGASLSGVGPEVIDLSSPSPSSLRPCKIIKSDKVAYPEVILIDLCESDTDVTPKHDRKARELRSFTDSIQRDLH